MQNSLSTWLRVSRINFLPVSLLPYTVGALWGLRAGAFSFGVFFAGLAGAGLVHVAANLFNEYWDFLMGGDGFDVVPVPGDPKACGRICDHVGVSGRSWTA